MTVKYSKTAKEIERLSLVFAIQDRETMLHGLSSDDPYKDETRILLSDFRRMYQNRFGGGVPSFKS